VVDDQPEGGGTDAAFAALKTKAPGDRALRPAGLRRALGRCGIRAGRCASSRACTWRRAWSWICRGRQEVFNAIMLTGSVSAAARLINITQPAVSRTLQHAELQLGFPLFQRAKGRLSPTTEALTLYPHIERLFAQLDEVQRLAANLKCAS
jgi:molybdenum-dependent DNA-binding transcriptional regulator ModE